MIRPVNDTDVHLGGRLLELLQNRSPWNRKLWNVGLSLTLREVLEAADAVSAGVLHQEALRFVAQGARKMVGTDPGAGTVEQKRTLQTSLKSDLRLHGLDYEVVMRQASRIRGAYLARWAGALRGPTPPRTERAARAIASHLLDMGYSSDFLHRWWKYRLHHEPGHRSFADIVDDAEGLAQASERRFEVMVPIARAIRLRQGQPPPAWRSARDVSAWLRRNGSDASGIRQDGGRLLQVEALDPHAAVARVAELLDQLAARIAVGTKGGLALLGHVWIEGVPRGFRLDHAGRGVWVEALERENQLYDLRYSSGTRAAAAPARENQPYDARSTARIRAAIELLAHLQSSSPGAAVAGGWAAIEALLSEPGTDRVQAADRLAMLVACSHPRAELTALSYAVSRGDGELAGRLRDLDDNRRRCDMVAHAISQGAVGHDRLSAADHAALVRTQEMLSEPRRIPLLVKEHAASAFRRLYRQRNMVLHGARMDAVALRASLRTAAPLVGAGIDRIVHAHYVDNLAPLPLTARATLAVATVGTTDGPCLAGLLE